MIDLNMLRFHHHHPQLFCAIANRLSTESVSYCVVGDYENLPDSIGHDIDIWTSDTRKTKEVILSEGKNHSFRPLVINDNAGGSNIILYRSDEGGFYLTKFDIFSSLTYKSIFTLLAPKHYEQNREDFKGFRVCNRSCTAFSHLIYPLFEWGQLRKEAYKNEILCAANSSEFRALLLSSFGPKTSAEILQVIQQGRWSTLYENAFRLRNQYLAKNLIRWSTVRNAILTCTSIIRRFMFPCGFSITICGLDGAGKSTVIAELRAALERTLKSKKVHFGYWRPYVLPELRALIGRPHSKDNSPARTPDTDKTRKKPGTLLSMIKLAYYCADYAIGAPRLRYIKATGGVVVFDRHYIDLLVHPERFEVGLPSWVISLAGKLVPKTDFTFFFWADPDTIHSRKKEFSRDEIVEQTQKYRHFGRSIRNFHPIECNQSIAAEIQQILEAVCRR